MMEASSLLRALHAAHNLPAPAIPRLAADLQEILHDAEGAAVAACSIDDVSEESRGSLYDRAATDGELLDNGVATLLGALSAPKSAVFADLGSGRGGALFRTAAVTEWRHCFGIEFLQAKHNVAEHALGSLRRSPVLRSPVTLAVGDILELDALATTLVGPGEGDDDETRLEELTHAYTCSVCFDDLLLRSLARSLGNRTLFPRFQALVSLRALPSQPYLTRVGELSLECSWNGAVTGHVYVPADVCERDEADCAIPLLAHCLCDSGVCALPAPLQPWSGRRYVRLPR